MSLFSRIIRIAAPIPKIDSFKRYLFIGPHPDDIEIGAGATVAKLAAMGKEITFLICLDGRFGLDNAPEGMTPSELISVRAREAVEAAKVLGVTDVRFLKLSDGGMYSTKDLLDLIAQTIGEVKPDIIFAPDPEVISECHIDHRNVGNCARQLAFFAPFKEIMESYGAETANVQAIAYYMTARVNRRIVTLGQLGKQLKAISCHESQYPAGCDDLKSLTLYLKLRSAYYGIKSLRPAAEGFRVLGRVHMHCLPEAGE